MVARSRGPQDSSAGMDQDRGQLVQAMSGAIQTKSSALRFLLPYLKRYRRSFALGFAALALKSGFGAAVPLFMRSSVDAFTAGTLGRVIGMAAVMLGLGVIRG